MDTYIHIHAVCNHSVHILFCRTWKNALLGEKVIEGLEEKSAELSKEKQDYIGE